MYGFISDVRAVFFNKQDSYIVFHYLHYFRTAKHHLNQTK